MAKTGRARLAGFLGTVLLLGGGIALYEARAVSIVAICLVVGGIVLLFFVVRRLDRSE